MTLEQLRRPIHRHPCLAGALFWLAFSLLAVLLRGVRWDENYEFAQVLLGQVNYPEGHPLHQYVHGFYSLQTWLCAAIMYVLPDPLPVNLLRNWAFLAASTVPVFLLGALFSGRQLPGHLAAVFILLGIHVGFYSAYPILVWPHIFSNGPIGLGYMLTTLWALLDKRHRLAGLLLGLAPAIHLGQLPPLLLLACALLAIRWRLGDHDGVRTLARWSLPGLVVCGLFALVVRAATVAPPTDGPWFHPAAPELLWKTAVQFHDSHRAIPFTTGHIVLIAAIALGALLIGGTRAGLRLAEAPGAPAPDRPLRDSAWIGALTYCALCAALVWGVMGAHLTLGPETPYGLLGWLPYRLMNHVSPVLIPLLLALASGREGRVPPWLLAALVAVLLAPLSHLALDSNLVNKYLRDGTWLFFYLLGGSLGTVLDRAARQHRNAGWAVGATAAALLGFLAWFHQFGAACAVTGLLFALVPVPPRLSPRMLRLNATALAGLLLLAMLSNNAERPEHLPRGPYHQAVAQYMAEAGKPDAMILVHHEQAGDQARFGHPVMADMATLLHGVYRPEIAPAVAAMYQDLYGVYLDPAAPRPDPPLKWFEIWPAKSTAEWHELGRKYGFEYISAPSFMNLPLELLLRGNSENFYRIPPEG